MTTTERPAEPGECCTCGRPAVVVYLTERFGAVGWCGRSDGGDRNGPCPFCGGERHDGDRCPAYRLRPEGPSSPQLAAWAPVNQPERSEALPDREGDKMTLTTHLHRDDTPLTLRLLDGLLGHRRDQAELGYYPDQWGAEVDWDRLTNGDLSTSEVAVVHIARGCAIAERHGGSLPASVRGPLRAVVNDLAPSTSRPRVRPGRRPLDLDVCRGGIDPDDAPLPGVDL